MCVLILQESTGLSSGFRSVCGPVCKSWLFIRALCTKVVMVHEFGTVGFCFDMESELWAELI